MTVRTPLYIALSLMNGGCVPSFPPACPFSAPRPSIPASTFTIVKSYARATYSKNMATDADVKHKNIRSNRRVSFILFAEIYLILSFT